MIQEISISAMGADDEEYYEPPARVLTLTVVGGDAYLALYDNGLAGRAAEPIAMTEVRAHSLLLALSAAIDDDKHGRDPSRP